MTLNKFLLTLNIFLFSTIVFSQKNSLYNPPNEKTIYSFQTHNGKIMTLNVDANLNYIVYRFGSKNIIELEFPTEKDKSSFEKFEYSHYFRPLQKGVEGMDLKYVTFINNGKKYVVYDNVTNYSKSREVREIGIKVFLATNETGINIKGRNKTKKGSLGYFSNKSLLKISSELYD